jgi:hypothetical protein
MRLSLSEPRSPNPLTMTSKTCSRCGQSRPLISENYRSGVRGTKEGWSTMCKPCERRRQQLYYERNKERISKAYKAPARGLGGPYGNA